MDDNKTSSASVSSVFGWEQFPAEKGQEGSRTYVYVTAASSQPKKPHDLFPPFLWNWQLAVYRLRTTMKAAKLFHPSVFTPTIFPSLYYDYDCAALKQSLPCLKDPLPAPAGPAVPRCAFGAALQQAEVLGSSNWEQAILSAAGAQTRGGITTVPWLSSSFGSPHGTCWHPASHRAETTGLSSLKELFFWSSTNFAQLQESSKWCVYFLSHCSQWFAVLKYVCAGSIDSSIIFIASFRKLLFPSRDWAKPNIAIPIISFFFSICVIWRREV